jgi:hypothetical protein
VLRSLRSLAAAVLLCLGLAGCSGHESDQADPPVPSPAVITTEAQEDKVPRAAPATTGEQAPAPDQRLRPGDLAVPANAEVIFAPFEGHGDRRLSFDPRRRNFGLVFSCDGEGRFDISTGPDLASPSPCRRGLPLRLTVATDGSPQALRVHTTPDTTWRMVVIEGDRLGPDVRLAHEDGPTHS